MTINLNGKFFHQHENGNLMTITLSIWIGWLSTVARCWIIELNNAENWEGNFHSRHQGAASAVHAHIVRDKAFCSIGMGWAYLHSNCHNMSGKF